MIGLVSAPGWAEGTFITAAINWPGGKAQFFLNDGTYVRYDIAADRADSGYPKPVNDSTWPGMGAYAGKIIAAFNTRDNKAIFILSTGEYLRYDIGADRVDAGYPRPVNDETWPGLAPFVNIISGALNWPGNKVQIFLGDGTYLRYDLLADHLDAGYPQPINNQTWPGLEPFATNISGAINWANGKAYIFFSDGRYVRYDIAADHVDDGYPKPINAQTWPGLNTYFQKR
jgi:hypothetical protein